MRDLSSILEVPVRALLEQADEREAVEEEYAALPREDVELAPSDALALFMREAGRYRLLTAAEEVELAKRVENGDPAAKERMINANLRLVISIAKRYQGKACLWATWSRRAPSA